MAENLKWICENKYPKEKIIVWAANAHIAKYSDSSGKNNENKLIAMGTFFTNDSSLSKETYTLGFTSYEGETGRVYSRKSVVPKPNSNGFETWINKDYNYAFVDFKKFHQEFPKESETFYLKGLAHNSAFKKDWSKIFDGMFFIKEMQPCQQ